MKPLDPRVIVLVVLVVNFAWALVIPYAMTEPPTAVHELLFAAGLVVFAAALLLGLHATVSTSEGRFSRSLVIALLAMACLVLWYPTHAWAEVGQVPYAWLAGFAIGAAALMSPRGGISMALLLVAAGVIGALVFSASVVSTLVISFGCTAGVWVMCHALVWLLRLLRAAEAAQDAEARLAVAEERLRASRELHDVLGHRLGIIALKAELASDMALQEPVAAASESNQIRELAASTMAEVRQAIHGDSAADLGAQLGAAELVLDSAGIATSVDVDAARIAHLPQETSRLFATVLREAVTNVLRHSDAHRVSIALTDTTTGPALMVTNDGLRSPRPGCESVTGGTGLAALAARCSAAGARLISGPSRDGSFQVRVEQVRAQSAPDLARTGRST